jgi:hypothetical protein
MPELWWPDTCGPIVLGPQLRRRYFGAEASQEDGTEAACADTERLLGRGVCQVGQVRVQVPQLRINTAGTKIYQH